MENINVKITRKKLFAFAGIAALVLSALALSAQHQRSHDPAAHIQHHVDHLTKVLVLTPAQQQQATAIFTDAMASGKSLHDQMRAAHDNLEAAVQKNDAAAIDQASSAIGSLTGQMTAAHAKAHAAFYQILTPDQRSKLSQFEEREHGMDGSEGPHGPKGPGHRGHGGPPPSPQGEK